MAKGTSKETSVRPYAFIVGFGLVSMLMDTVYEGALASQGPLLASLGASALVVGIVSGLGEATALAGRLFSGPLADRTGRYWTFAILGYAATAVAVPCMGFAGSVAGVAALVILERFGKSLRTPSRDTMLSHAASATGRGRGFALHEVFDQIGAVAGPLIVAALLSATGNDYRVALGVLVIPGLLAICVLLALRHKVPDPSVYEAGDSGEKPESKGKTAEKRAPLPRRFWLYAIACAVMLAGVATYGVLSYHMVSSGVADDATVPVLYAVAMGVDALFAALSGFLYDKIGTRAMRVLPFVCAAIPFVAYTDVLWLVFAGVVLWGAGMGIQESTMRAAVADIAPTGQRATAYGVFSVMVGIGGLVGGVMAGWLYGVSLAALVAYTCCVEAVALALMLRATQQEES
ncbi:MAG: MFS transporter [Tractidigestivibacter sp.]|uniref:MFS transporter n=1 Tax=Tractidigestivibacter sp. TaxID=2847320 RepID=UPI003D92C246